MKKKIVKIILKSLLVIAIIAGIAVSGYFILKACGFTTQEDFERLRSNLGDSFLFWFIIGCLQVVQVIFIPISNQIITVPLALMFPIDELWKVWLTSWLSIWLATIILYIIGRFAGEKILNWILSDKESTEKCTKFLNKGYVFYPIAMLLPLPDDIVTVLAGTAKMNIVYIIICSMFTRAIDVACSVFGFGILTKYWWGWVILSVGIVLLLLGTFLYWRWNKKKELKAKEIEEASKCPYYIDKE